MLKLSADQLAAIDARDRQNAFEIGFAKQASDLGLSAEEAAVMRKQLAEAYKAAQK